MPPRCMEVESNNEGAPQFREDFNLSVVIPAYRSEASLDALVQRLLPALDQLGCSYEVVFVEDGSPDETWSKIESIQQRYPDRIVAVQLMRNSGQHNALMCGFRHARGEIIVTMDDDLQNPPEEIEKLIEELDRTNLDLVYGRYADKKHESFRNIGSQVVNYFYRSVFNTGVTVTSFRAIRRRLIEAILSHTQSYLFLDGLLAWNTRRIGSVLVEHHSRQLGCSTYSIAKLLTLSMNLFTNFSLLPLQVVSVTGALTIGCGLSFVGFVVVRSFLAGAFSSVSDATIAVICFLSGLQLLSLGLMGEYLGRILMTANGKPQYFERQVLRTEPSTKTATVHKQLHVHHTPIKKSA